MDPTPVTGFPSAVYTNPVFYAAFGAAAAIGLILVGLSYLVFMRIRSGVSQKEKDPLCTSCGLTTDQIKNFACAAHDSLFVRMKNIEERQNDQRQDINKAHDRIDILMRSGKGM